MADKAQERQGSTKLKVRRVTQAAEADGDRGSAPSARGRGGVMLPPSSRPSTTRDDRGHNKSHEPLLHRPSNLISNVTSEKGELDGVSSTPPAPLLREEAEEAETREKALLRDCVQSLFYGLFLECEEKYKTLLLVNDRLVHKVADADRWAALAERRAMFAEREETAAGQRVIELTRHLDKIELRQDSTANRRYNHHGGDGREGRSCRC